MLTRTRTLFRVMGERMGSFELSRQITVERCLGAAFKFCGINEGDGSYPLKQAVFAKAAFAGIDKRRVKGKVKGARSCREP